MQKTILHQGRFANADVWKVTMEDSRVWVVKDFSKRSWFFRYLIGVPLILHEYVTLQKLAGVDGIPTPVFKIDRFAFIEPFYGSSSLRFNKEDLSTEYFEALEKALHDIHQRKIFHLDLRNARNIMVVEGKTPVLIDWQSALRFRYIPRFLARLLAKIDMSGIYKHWARYRPDTLGLERTQLLFWQLKLRKFWRIRPYRDFFSFKPRELEAWEIRFAQEQSKRLGIPLPDCLNAVGRASGKGTSGRSVP